MKLRVLALAPALALIAACGGNSDATPTETSETTAVASAPTTSATSTDISAREYIANIRRSGVSNTSDPVIMELAEATCTASGMVDAAKSENFAVDLLEMSPKYLDPGTEDAFVQVTLDQFCTASPQHASSASASTATGSVADTTYLKLLNSNNLGYLEDEQAISIGTLVCEGLDAGRGVLEIGSQIARDSNGLFTLNEGATFVGAAIAAYCPTHEDLLQN